MKHVVCYSGGEASALAGVAVVGRYGTENTILLNHRINPRLEHPDIQRFKEEVAAYLGLPVTYANVGGIEDPNLLPDQFDVCMAAKAFKVGTGTELCTNRLKTAPFMAWLLENIPDKNCTCYYGFERHEVHRITRRHRILGEMGYAACAPLAEWQTPLRSIREIGIEPPCTYAVWKHANCVGCLKAGKQHWYCVYCLRRDVWEKAKVAEAYIGYTIHRGEPLAVLEPLFERMRLVGIEPTEQKAAGQFWADAKRALARAASPNLTLELEML